MQDQGGPVRSRGKRFQEPRPYSKNISYRQDSRCQSCQEQEQELRSGRSNRQNPRRGRRSRQQERQETRGRYDLSSRFRMADPDVFEEI
ncbi:hypothetical protein TNIN_41561 [Trichonephila inaurata madagascariensis]|uniref:Uncharacterized protein n=1 Tax=Trichonephila inaurata madagascariensis TaxID=2747483 RepID=A0A8X6M539_9ARAC|nr:hypothetical protein TNIN_41561 [Trichonephila inaurata madagascariensis]